MTANVIELKGLGADQRVARDQWQKLANTGLRPSILLESDRKVLDKAAFNVLGLDKKERAIIDMIYGEVFNAAGAIRIADEEHLLRAYESGDPHAYIEENIGLVAQDNESSGLGRLNADDLHVCIDEKTTPSPASNTSKKVRDAVIEHTNSDRVWPIRDKYAVSRGCAPL